jgi:hypothetical protein
MGSNFMFKGAVLFLLIITNGCNVAHAGAITISAVGDTMLGGLFPDSKLPPNGPDFMFDDARSILTSSDLTFGNLEGVLVERDTRLNPRLDKAYNFASPSDYARAYAQAGFDFLSLTNNHANDFGDVGLEDTRNSLREYSIQFSSSQKQEVASFEVKGTRLGVIGVGFQPGPRSLRAPGPIYNEIKMLKKNFDIIVVSVHLGAEGANSNSVTREDEIFMGENRGNIYEFAHRAIDAGADLILGLEVYKSRLIVYSLGNFATYGGISVQGPSGVAPVAEIEIDSDGRFLEGTLHSFRQGYRTGPKLDRTETAYNWMKTLSIRDFQGSAPEFVGSSRFIPSDLKN